MNSFELEKPTPYYMQFYEQMKHMIFNGEFQPSERINETQLAKRFGVSRSPVREAMRLLEKDELLIADHKSGYMVYAPTERDVDELYHIRIALESLAVQFACTEASEEELSQIEDLYYLADDAIQQKNEPKEIIRLHEAFHQAIIHASHNERLFKQLNHVNALIHFCRILNFSGENRAETIQQEHAMIITELKRRNVQQAINAITTHLTHDLAHLKQVLKDS
ncbi:GntR family transcriptional regulator [Bacillus sp. NPDC077027]|uniref:GntR family transcriptional regulator n=1 Tax=Bacillus sp. NPDC077027 TaxID=3390548 RepID=UPI003D0334B3